MWGVSFARNRPDAAKIEQRTEAEIGFLPAFLHLARLGPGIGGDRAMVLARPLLFSLSTRRERTDALPLGLSPLTRKPTQS